MIMALKLKIAIRYNNVIVSPDILILLSMDSSLRIWSSWAYLIPAHRLSLLLSIRPPLLESIHKIRSLGDCDMLIYIT